MNSETLAEKIKNVSDEIHKNLKRGKINYIDGPIEAIEQVRRLMESTFDLEKGEVLITSALVEKMPTALLLCMLSMDLNIVVGDTVSNKYELLEFIKTFLPEIYEKYRAIL